MSQPDALPDANAIPGAFSTVDVGLLTNSTVGANISVVNRDYRLLYVNAHYAKSCATTQDKLIGLSLFDLHDEAQMRELAPYFNRVHAGETVSYVRLSRIGELDSRWVTVSLSPWRGRAGEINGSVLVSMPVHDIKVNAETLRAANERLTSHIDNSPLTGVSNRRALTDRIDQAAQCVERRLSLLLVDLDGFKAINDTHGHAAGDEVWCEVARRLNEFAPAVDAVARIGGDEFVLLIEGKTTNQSNQWLAEFATRIMHALEAPYAIGGMQLRISASIGVAQCPPVAPDSVELIRLTDMAMYDAKRAGKARVRFAHSQITR